MCEPVTLTTGLMYASMAVSAVGAYGQYQSGKAQTKAVNKQNELQAQEIAEQAGLEMTERARAARRERGAMRAAGAESGISLASGSFLDGLQVSVANQYNDQGLILRNESNQQRARDANTKSALARIEMPTALTAALNIGAAGLNGYTAGASATAAGRASAT